MSFRILLADDEAHITHVVARRLESSGYCVEVAHDGEEAWEKAQERPPDLVVTDLQMPYISGIDLAVLLRGHEPTSRIPIIMLTARGYIMEDAQLNHARITRLLSKPFSVRRLVEQIEALLSGADDQTLREAA